MNLSLIDALKVVTERQKDYTDNTFSISPETYGAKGDGKTDDSDAIQEAIDSTYPIKFMAKTYCISKQLVIPSGRMIDFGGATIVPMSNINIIKMKPGCSISRLNIKTTKVNGWDKTALDFSGSLMFRASAPTRVTDVTIINDTTYGRFKHQGVGIYMHVDNPYEAVEGVYVENLLTAGLGKGIYIYGDVVSGYTADTPWINMNVFNNYMSFKDTIGICMDCLYQAEGNFFTNFSLQSDYYDTSDYGVYCNASRNLFSGAFWDYSDGSRELSAHALAVHGHFNKFECLIGNPNAPDWYQDDGKENIIYIQDKGENTILKPIDCDGYGFIGNQDDVFAYIDKKEDCTWELLDGGATAVSNPSALFDPNPATLIRVTGESPSVNTGKSRLTMNFAHTPIKSLRHLILQFYYKQYPLKIKIKAIKSDGTEETIYNTENNGKNVIDITFGTYNYSLTNVKRLIFDFSGFTNIYEYNGKQYGSYSITRIMAADCYQLGNSWLSTNGGNVQGDIEFISGNPIIKSNTNKRFKLVVSDDGTLSTEEISGETQVDSLYTEYNLNRIVGYIPIDNLTKNYSMLVEFENKCWYLSSQMKLGYQIFNISNTVGLQLGGATSHGMHYQYHDDDFSKLNGSTSVTRKRQWLDTTCNYYIDSVSGFSGLPTTAVNPSNITTHTSTPPTFNKMFTINMAGSDSNIASIYGKNSNEIASALLARTISPACDVNANVGCTSFKNIILYSNGEYTTYNDMIAHRSEADIDLRYDASIGKFVNKGTSGDIVYNTIVRME